MNILITGGTGLVGSRLTEVLVEERNHVYILSRSEHSDDHPFIHYIKYDPDDINNLSWAEELPVNMDAVYNFAGASLQKIWTDSHKEEIMDSRINTTRLLYNWVKNSEIKPDVLVNASAVEIGRASCRERDMMSNLSGTVLGWKLWMTNSV